MSWYILINREFYTLYIGAAETARKINQAFGNDSVNERTIQGWFAKFRSGDFSLEDEPRSGRPIVIQDEDLRILVETETRHKRCVEWRKN